MLTLFFLFNFFILTHSLECQKLTAYYIGTFQNSYKPSFKYKFQFQLSLNADHKERRVYAKVDYWNETYTDSGSFDIDFLYYGAFGE